MGNGPISSPVLHRQFHPTVTVMIYSCSKIPTNWLHEKCVVHSARQEILHLLQNHVHLRYREPNGLMSVNETLTELKHISHIKIRENWDQKLLVEKTIRLIFTGGWHQSLPWARRIQSVTPYCISLISILMLSSHLCPGTTNGLFPSVSSQLQSLLWHITKHALTCHTLCCCSSISVMYRYSPCTLFSIYVLPSEWKIKLIQNNEWLTCCNMCSTEPNAFSHVFGTPLSGSQLGLDFVTLRHLLNSYPRYNTSLLVGPDVTRPIIHQTGEQPIPYLKSFLAQATSVISAITWHQ